MSARKLTGHALLNIHCDINIDNAKIIDRFSITNRKKRFTLQFFLTFLANFRFAL